MLKDLVEARAKYNAKNEIFAKVMKESATAVAGEQDFKQVKELGDEFPKLSTVAQIEKIRTLNTEVMDLFDQMKALDTSDFDSAYKIRDEDSKNRPNPMIHPAAGEKKEIQAGYERKSVGDWFCDPESQFIKNLKAGKRKFTVTYDDLYPSQIAELGLKSVFPLESKTLFETAAGWSAESIRLPGWVDAPTRPVQVIDTIPVGRTGQAAVVYMLETTRTHAAAEKGEGLAYAESTFALTATTQTVRKITDSIPVTDEQLDDVQQAETYLRARLGFGLRQRLDTALLTGLGTGVLLLGANNVTGINTQALAADTVPDAVYKGMDLVRTVGFANPGVVYFHPTDWQSIRLLRTTDGIYIWGNPSEAGPLRIWGVPVVLTTAQTLNTALILDNSPAMCMFFERAGVEIEAGWVNAQFTEGEQTLRSQMRGAMVWFRASAITEVTGI